MNLSLRILSESARILEEEGLSSYVRQVLEKIGRGELTVTTPPPIPSADLPAVARLPSEVTALHSQATDTSLRQDLQAFLQSKDSQLEFPTNTNPLVSAVIISYNRAHYLMQCLRSLLKSSIVSVIEVIVVDNASEDHSSQLLAKTKNVTVIHNQFNEFFGPACNQGARIARGQYILFLNQDVFVHPSCVASLVATLDSSETIAAAGAKILSRTGRLLEAGSIVWRDGSVLGYGRGDDPSKPEYCFPRDVDYCSAACLMVRRPIFAKLDGFDAKFVPAYYEDIDFCLRAWNAGLRVVFQPYAVTSHVEFGASSFDEASSLMHTQSQLFLQKHMQTLQTYFTSSHRNIIQARDRKHNPSILIIDDCIPKPSDGSGYPRMYQMLKIIASAGYRITLLPLSDRRPKNPETDELIELGIEVLWGNMRLHDTLQSRRNYYELALVSRPHNAEKSFKVIRKYNANCKIIYDAEALWYRREELKQQLGIRTVYDTGFTKPEAEESILRNADRVISVSELESRLIEKMSGGGKKPLVWGHPHPLTIANTPWKDRKDLLFVGGFKGSPSANDDAVTYFVERIFPKILKRISSCKFFIVGSNPPLTVARLASDSVIVTGYVENLDAYYDSARVFVAPMRFGAGLSWKVTEAMSHGLPCVLSETAAQGIDGRPLVALGDDDFADKTIQVYNDRTLWEQIRDQEIEYIRKNCDPATMKERMRKFLLDVRACS